MSLFPEIIMDHVYNGESWNDFYFGTSSSELKQPEIVYIAPLQGETGVFDR